MRIHVLEHVPFEGPGHVAAWARAGGHAVSRVRLYGGEPAPPPDAFDWLVILGGPMGANDDDRLPWMREEKRCLARAIEEEKLVLGICLGAQLIAAVLGAPVTRNREKEIGWFPVELTPEAARSVVFSTLPNTFPALHWHGDTFAIPRGALHTARSEACENQAFEYAGRVVGLQFHLEATRESLALVDHCAHELVPAPFVQTAERILASEAPFAESNALMDRLLDALASRAPAR